MATENTSVNRAAKPQDQGFKCVLWNRSAMVGEEEEVVGHGQSTFKE